MENSNLSKSSVAFGVSLALCSVVNALIVIAKEKSQAVSAAMQKMTGHHWITHAAVVIFLFVVLGWVFSGANGGRGLNLSTGGLTKTLVAGVAVGCGIILGFYLIAGFAE